MAHFFANPLSILLSKDAPVDSFQSELCEAIRNLPSFRRLVSTSSLCSFHNHLFTWHRYVQRLLDEGHAKQARRLLNDDKFLAQDVTKNVRIGQGRVSSIFQSVEAVVAILQFFKGPKRTDLSDLAIQALSGELYDSRIIQEKDFNQW